MIICSPYHPKVASICLVVEKTTIYSVFDFLKYVFYVLRKNMRRIWGDSVSFSCKNSPSLLPIFLVVISPLHVQQWRHYIISSGVKLNQNSKYSCSQLIGDYAQAPIIYIWVWLFLGKEFMGFHILTFMFWCYTELTPSEFFLDRSHFLKPFDNRLICNFIFYFVYTSHILFFIKCLWRLRMLVKNLYPKFS